MSIRINKDGRCSIVRTTREEDIERHISCNDINGMKKEITYCNVNDFNLINEHGLLFLFSEAKRYFLKSKSVNCWTHQSFITEEELEYINTCLKDFINFIIKYSYEHKSLISMFPHSIDIGFRNALNNFKIEKIRKSKNSKYKTFEKEYDELKNSNKYKSSPLGETTKLVKKYLKTNKCLKLKGVFLGEKQINALCVLWIFNFIVNSIKRNDLKNTIGLTTSCYTILYLHMMETPFSSIEGGITGSNHFDAKREKAFNLYKENEKIEQKKLKKLIQKELNLEDRTAQNWAKELKEGTFNPRIKTN